MKQQQRLDRALESFVRINFTEWSPDADEASRKQLKTRVAALIKSARNGEGALALQQQVAATDAARLPFDELRKMADTRLKELVRELPVWDDVSEIRGFAEGGFAAIIGEAGELSNYANPAKLWKRMGVGLVDGERQKRPPAGCSQDLAMHIAYSPERRSIMWTIGDCLIKSNRNGPYRAAYDTRKAYELERTPDMKPMHAHRRAQRYMEKRLLKDLWQAWRRTSVSAEPSGAVSAA